MLLTNWIVSGNEIMSPNNIIQTTTTIELTGAYNGWNFLVRGMVLDAQSNLYPFNIVLDGMQITIKPSTLVTLNLTGVNSVTFYPNGENILATFYSEEKKDARFSAVATNSAVTSIDYQQFGLYGQPLEIVKAGANYTWKATNPAPFNTGASISNAIQVLAADQGRRHIIFTAAIIFDNEAVRYFYNLTGAANGPVLACGQYFFDAPLFLGPLYLGLIKPSAAHADGSYTVGYITTEVYK